MGSDNELRIKIGADTKDIKAAYENIKTETEDLDEKLGKIAKISGVAFAALSAQVGVALHAFAEAQLSSNDLSNALQNQGIFTEELKTKYLEYADAVSRTTGIEGEQIVKAQAVAQSFLGQVPVTKQLTQAIADLATKEGISLPSAAEQLGKAIGNGTGMLLRQGLQFSATDTEATRYQKTLDFVSLKAGGMADAANTGLGSIKGLQAAFRQSQEELGARFAPAAEYVIKLLTDFLTPAKSTSGAMVDLKAALIAVGLVVTGIGVVIPTAAMGFNAMRAAALALNITLGATKVALMGLGIGLVIVALTELVLHWDWVKGRTIAAVQGLVAFVSGAFSGLGKVIDGVFHLDVDKIKEGLAEIGQAFKDGTAKAAAELPKETKKALDQQDALKKIAADKDAQRKRESEAVRMQLQRAEDDAIMLELKGASQAQIELKKQEIETLRAIEGSKNEEQKRLLKERLKETTNMEVEQRLEDEKREKEFNEIDLEMKKEFNEGKVGYDANLQKKEMAQLRSTTKTEKDIYQDMYRDRLKEEIKAHNTYLAEKNKFGVAYATISQALHSSEIAGMSQASGQLVQLTQSKNDTLKSIGKGAAVAQITIKTGEGAMAAYEGFVEALGPIFGTPLGIAAAAAMVAFGVEQIDTVLSAASGGLVTGGISGRDSVPAMLMPGEVVVPAQNYDELISSVVAQRTGTQGAESDGAGATIVLELKDKLMDFVEAKLVQRKFLNISLQGSR